MTRDYCLAQGEHPLDVDRVLQRDRERLDALIASDDTADGVGRMGVHSMTGETGE